MVHQSCQPTSCLHRCNRAITQGFTDDAMKRFVAVINGHSFIKCNEIGAAAAGPQIINHAIFEVDSHNTVMSSWVPC